MATTLITRSTGSRVAELLELAIRGLASMYDADRRLFCYRVRQSASGLIREGVSQRYTLITLLGLRRAEAAGFRSPVNIDAILDSLFSSTAWIDNLGDLGLLLWLCALSSDDHLERFFNAFDLEREFRRYPEANARHTMELAWFLSGLAHAAETYQRGQPELPRLAAETYELLRTNQGPDGIFGHQSRWHSLAGVVRGRIGSFADQVYPIYAMAQFARACKVDEASHRALCCADAICSLQGPLGQWWWHYDSVTGRVVERYPVYSVHQDGMAPMALFAVQEACGADFSEHIYEGLAWINGSNELRQDLEDTSANVIWRSIFHPKLASYSARIRALVGPQPSPHGLQVLYECRPYHLGWLLYAFAPKVMNANAELLHTVGRVQ